MNGIDPDLVRLLKRLKLGPLLPTLPERLTLARAQHLDYVAFLTLLLADEVQRRDQQALERHLDQAGFEDRVTLDGFDWTSPVQVDRRQLQHVFTLEFLVRKEHVVFVGWRSASARRAFALATRCCSCALMPYSPSLARPEPTAATRRCSAAIWRRIWSSWMTLACGG